MQDSTTEVLLTLKKRLDESNQLLSSLIAVLVSKHLVSKADLVQALQLAVEVAQQSQKQSQESGWLELLEKYEGPKQ